MCSDKAVLVVSEDVVSLQRLGSAVRELGLAVVEAASGNAVMGICRHLRFDMIVIVIEVATTNSYVPDIVVATRMADPQCRMMAIVGGRYDEAFRLALKQIGIQSFSRQENDLQFVCEQIRDQLLEIPAKPLPRGFGNPEQVANPQQ